MGKRIAQARRRTSRRPRAWPSTSKLAKSLQEGTRSRPAASLVEQAAARARPARSCSTCDHDVKAENYGYQEITLANGTTAAGAGRADPLAAVGPHRRRPDGRAGQPPARRGRHLHQRPARRRQEGPAADRLGRRAAVAVPARSRLRGPRLLHVRVPRPRLRRAIPNKKIGVTYSSINGNGFGGYGETVLGTKGTLILEREQEVMLFSNERLDDDQRHGVQGQARRPHARHHAKRRRRGGGRRPRRPLDGPGQPRLHRGDRALGLVHPQSRSRRTSPAAIPRWPWATP